MPEQTIENQILAEIRKCQALIAVKNDAWVPLDMFMTLTGLGRGTVHNYVCTGKIIKKKRLYSYRSYLEYAGIK